MTRSLTAMRVWLTMEAQDLAIVQYKNRRPRVTVRGIVIARIALEMAQNGYDIKNYQADVDEIIDCELDKLYGTERQSNEDMAKVASEEAQAERHA